MDKKEKILREELVRQLTKDGAHVTFEDAIAEIPSECYGKSVKGLPYTLWRLLQHMKISQKDILDYIQDPDYKERSWPEEYWPKQKVPPTLHAWDEAVADFLRDRKAIVSIVLDPKTKLYESVPYVKKGHTILHEVLLLADHNSYHIGQIILLRGLLGIWQD